MTLWRVKVYELCRRQTFDRVSTCEIKREYLSLHTIQVVCFAIDHFCWRQFGSSRGESVKGILIQRVVPALLLSTHSP